MDQILTRAIEIGILTLGGAFTLIFNTQRAKEREIFERLREAEIEIATLKERILDVRSQSMD